MNKKEIAPAKFIIIAKYFFQLFLALNETIEKIEPIRLKMPASITNIPINFKSTFKLV